MNRQWLRSREGIQFLADVVEHTRKQLNVSYSEGFTNNALAGTPDTDWAEAVNDFLTGVGGAIGQSDLGLVDPNGELSKAIETAYKMRFYDTYASLNVTLTRHQATTLGLITGAIYRIHKGEIVPHTKKYPRTDPTLTSPTTVHLSWARDVLGFWVCDLNNYDVGVPNPTPPKTSSLVEFDNGCTLC